MSKLYLMSLGCNKNLVDSEIMLGRLSAYELCDEPSKADVIIVNTCGFIDSAKKESINAILDLHEQRKKRFSFGGYGLFDAALPRRTYERTS
ncbi:hypothetical protein OLV29_07725 [Campylobacter jejuni]|nr:hypothetical protein [Campylobacter jejuni]